MHLSQQLKLSIPFFFLFSIQSIYAQFNDWKASNHTQPVKTEIINTYDGLKGEKSPLFTRIIHYSTNGLITKIIGIHKVHRSDSIIEKFFYEKNKLKLIKITNQNSSNYVVFTGWNSLNKPNKAIYTSNLLSEFGFISSKDSNQISYEYQQDKLKTVNSIHYVPNMNGVTRFSSSEKHTYNTKGNIQTITTSINDHGDTSSFTKSFTYLPKKKQVWTTQIEQQESTTVHSIRELTYFTKKEINQQQVKTPQLKNHESNITVSKMMEIAYLANQEDQFYWFFIASKSMTPKIIDTRQYEYFEFFAQAYQKGLVYQRFDLLLELATHIESISSKATLKMFANLIRWNTYYQTKEYQKVYEINSLLEKQIKDWTTQHPEKVFPNFLIKNDYIQQYSHVLFKVGKTKEALKIINDVYASITEATPNYEIIIHDFAYVAKEVDQLEWAEKFLIKLKDFYGKDKKKYATEYKATLVELINIKKLRLGK